LLIGKQKNNIMAIKKSEIKNLSKNPVQQDCIEEIDAVLCVRGDDIYDFANQVAALRKYADHLEKENSEYFYNEAEASPTTFKRAVSHAMNDWNGFNEKKFVRENYY